MITAPTDNPANKKATARFFYSLPLVLGTCIALSDIFSFLSAQLISVYLDKTICSLFSIETRFGNINPASSAQSQNLFLVLGAITSTFLWSKGHYTNRTPWWSQVEFIAKTIIALFFIHILIGLALKINMPLLQTALAWCLTFLIIFFLRAAIYKISSYNQPWLVPTVIISDITTAEDLVYALTADISTNFAVKSIFLRNPEDNIGFDTSILPPSQNVRICYGQDDHESFIQTNPDYFYIVSLDTFHDSARETIIRTLNDNNAPYAIVPALSRANLYQMEPKYFFGHDIVMMYVSNSAPRIFGISLSRILKRMMDISISGFGLILVSPLFAIISASLKIEGQSGSLFYGGTRIGKDGKLFKCWKFRSMEPNSAHLLESYLAVNEPARHLWGKYRKLENDPRVTTRTAKFIRKTSLDEIPQLWNIFTGDMSLVGPRPILEDEMGYFDDSTLKEYLSIRPGLTGLWQVSGRNKTSFKRRVYWDSWYVRNWSLWGDVVILIKTPMALLNRKGPS